MTYVFTLAHLSGWPVGEQFATHGVRTLRTTMRDSTHGGWFDAADLDGRPLRLDKSCYNHSFVLLAASVSAVAGIPGGTELFSEAADIHETWFWDETAGCCRDTWDRTWSACDPYRGANGNMHALESYLFAYAVGEDQRWLDRGLRIADMICRRSAGELDSRIPEHFDDSWQPLAEYNQDKPADPFKPYGATPGHGFEWARLLVQLEAHLEEPPAWLLDTAARLFARAASDTQDGVEGFCYTTNWHGRPVVTERFHWVQAEAIAAADSLARRTGEHRYRNLADQWWQFAAARFVDPATGSWHHELDIDGTVSRRTWEGKPDAYHVLNALTLPDLPLSTTAAKALVMGLSEGTSDTPGTR